MCSYLQVTKSSVFSLYIFICRIAEHRTIVGYSYRLHAQSSISQSSLGDGRWVHDKMFNVYNLSKFYLTASVAVAVDVSARGQTPLRQRQTTDARHQ